MRLFAVLLVCFCLALPMWARIIVQAPENMALIAGGTTHMGIDRDELAHFQEVFKIKAPQLFEDEIPKHTVTLDNFYIDKQLVTNNQFKGFIDLNPAWLKDAIDGRLHNGNYLKGWTGNSYPEGEATHPVVNVSWYAAVAYCQSQSKRLPTEAEWEFAARGGLQRPVFPWGDEAPDVSRTNYSASRFEKTSSVGKYAPNGLGLYDMAGNAWEFTADEWRPYRSGSSKNPVGGGDLFESGNAYLTVTTRRVIRGGSWGAAPINLWVEYRDSHPPDGAREFVGFRCAKSV